MSSYTQDNYFVITGPPGAGKSSILAELHNRSQLTVPEAARAIITEQRAVDGEGVYDRNPFLFKELMLSRTIAQYQQYMAQDARVFFDRGIVDIIAYSDCFQLSRGAEVKAAKTWLYNRTVFFLPAWEAIYTNDAERRISFSESLEFGCNLAAIYRAFGYSLIEVPMCSIKDRSEFILEVCDEQNIA